MKERRTFTRAKISCLICYNRVNNGRPRIVMSKNISAIGAMFLAEEFLPCNTSLDLRLKIPNVKGYIKLKGKVVRVQSTAGVPLYKTAIKFSHPSQKINQFLHNSKK